MAVPLKLGPVLLAGDVIPPATVVDTSGETAQVEAAAQSGSRPGLAGGQDQWLLQIRLPFGSAEHVAEAGVVSSVLEVDSYRLRGLPPRNSFGELTTARGQPNT